MMYESCWAIGGKKMNRNQIMDKAIHKYGFTTQQIVVMEELAELTQALSKMLRGLGSINSLIEEMADVYICLDEIKMIYDIDPKEIDDEIKYKLVRLNDRMENEND